MDWAGCELVEVVPGKVSGVPLVVGTRIPADVILRNFEAGSPVEEIEENYPALNSEIIARLLSFALPAMEDASREGASRRRPAAQAEAAIPNHDVSTVAYLGWAGLKNGDLLRKAEREGFEVFVTGDKNLSYQQNLSVR